MSGRAAERRGSAGDAPAGRELLVGDEVVLDIGPVAHGGSCVARADGRVVFVRYALPGERAVVRITEARKGKYCRGEATEILRADPRRVVPPCVHFGPGGCGGCDFQHASASLQRELKAAVVSEQLKRLAGLDVSVTVEPLPGDGFRWRTRVRWAVERAGTGENGSTGYDDAGYDDVLGPRRYRSHRPVPISAERPCLIAAEGLSEAAAGLRAPRGVDQVSLVRTAGGPPAVAWWRDGRVWRSPPDGPAGELTEQAAGHSFTVATTGFWQAHADAADTFCQAVVAALDGAAAPGATAWDLYGGVGLFAAVLADLVGESGRVVTVESDRSASALAARNLADRPQVRAVASRVDRALAGSEELRGPANAAELPPVHIVILDPPRSGAGERVCRTIAGRGPKVIVYVACDPAALARDTATLMKSGYRLDALRAFDAFPQTHHVECIARFIPAA